jgi:hypothetical protein
MDVNFGIRTNGFSFTISGVSNLAVEVEASAGLTPGEWAPVATNILDGGESRFSDRDWTNFPARFYRLSPP